MSLLLSFLLGAAEKLIAPFVSYLYGRSKEREKQNEEVIKRTTNRPRTNGDVSSRLHKWRKRIK